MFPFDTVTPSGWALVLTLGTLLWLPTAVAWGILFGVPVLAKIITKENN
jgi:hypothetical protein